MSPGHSTLTSNISTEPKNQPPQLHKYHKLPKPPSLDTSTHGAVGGTRVLIASQWSADEVEPISKSCYDAKHGVNV